MRRSSWTGACGRACGPVAGVDPRRGGGGSIGMAWWNPSIRPSRIQPRRPGRQRHVLACVRAAQGNVRSREKTKSESRSPTTYDTAMRRKLCGARLTSKGLDVCETTSRAQSRMDIAARPRTATMPPPSALRRAIGNVDRRRRQAAPQPHEATAAGKEKKSPARCAERRLNGPHEGASRSQPTSDHRALTRRRTRSAPAVEGPALHEPAGSRGGAR